MIPYGRQDVTQADIDAVVQVLRSDFLTQGPMVPRFELAVRKYCGAQYAVAVNSATSALHIACLALGLGPGDWLWTSPITFVASANCALYCGAQVDFVDIDSHTYELSVSALEVKLAEAEKMGRLPKIVVPVHLCGQSCEMRAIHELSRKYGFKIVEDASHAIGAKYQGQPVGDCRYSDIAVFSFHPVKIITTAEGGMAVTNDSQLAERMVLLRSHGITRDPSLMTHPPEDPWYYQQVTLGYNYRMTDVQAALGISQMQRVDSYVQRRHDLADRYSQALADLPVTAPWQHPDTYSSFHLYVIRLKLNEIVRSHRQVFECMRNHGIGVNLHYIPVYSQPYYLQSSESQPACAEADQYYQEAITLPLYPTLTDHEQAVVIDVLKAALR